MAKSWISPSTQELDPLRLRLPGNLRERGNLWFSAASSLLKLGLPRKGQVTFEPISPVPSKCVPVRASSQNTLDGAAKNLHKMPSKFPQNPFNSDANMHPNTEKTSQMFDTENLSEFPSRVTSAGMVLPILALISLGHGKACLGKPLCFRLDS